MAGTCTLVQLAEDLFANLSKVVGYEVKSWGMYNYYMKMKWTNEMDE